MRISTATVGEVGEGVRPFEVEDDTEPSYVEAMKAAKGDTHDNVVATCLGNASAWAYSDADTFARMMHRRGGIRYNETVSVRFANNALLVDSEAFVCQSKDKKLVILAFGGTNPVNLIQLLLDVTPRTDAFWNFGKVHGSFFRAALTLWPTVKKLLLFALGGRSLCSGAESERSRTRGQCELRAGVAQDEPSEDEGGSMPAVYITGHSLGGALAVLTAALIYRDPAAEPIWNNLRAIYTYGQPMVGSEDFADKFRDIIGGRLFRHVYGNDFVPTLPSRTAGSFEHIGAELRSTEQGWLPQATRVGQSRSFLTTVISGTMAFLAEQLPDIWTSPLLSPLRPLRRLLPLLPKGVWRGYFPQVSLYDHLAVNYLRTSRILPGDSELF